MTIRLGIIGCGRIVEDAHAMALRNLTDIVTVAALADVSGDRRAAVMAVLGDTSIPGFDNWEQMIGEATLDAVLVALPHHLHEPAIVCAARAGLDVLSEKPLATTLEEVDHIAGVVGKHGIRFGIVHNFLFNAVIAESIQAIEEERIGDVFFIRAERLYGTPYQGVEKRGNNWRTESGRSGGGALTDNGYHDIYVAEAQARSPVVRVYASIGQFVRQQDVEDTAIVTLIHKNGATTVLQVSWAIDGGGALVHEVHGSAGSIRIRQADYETVHAGLLGRKVEQGPIPESVRPPVEIHQNDAGRWEALLQPGEEGQWIDGIQGLQRATFSAWAEGRDSPFGLAEARHNVAVLRAAYLSASEGREVAVSELE